MRSGTKSAAALMLALLLALLLPLAAIADITPAIRCPEGQAYAELLAAPTADAQVIGRYFGGVFAAITGGTTGAYTAVSIGGNTGFMETAYLELTPAENPVSAVLPVIAIENSSGIGLNLRVSTDIGTQESPAYSAALFANDSQVTVLGVLRDWAYVQVGGFTGYMRLYGLPALAQYALEGEPSLYFDQMTKRDTHGYTVTATLQSTAVRQYTAIVGISFNTVMLNGILVGYNVYADEFPCGHLLASGWVGDNAQDGAPIAFSGSFSVPEGATRIRLQPVWSRSGFWEDGEEDTYYENNFVFGLAE